VATRRTHIALAATNPGAEELELAAACVAKSHDNVANLALLGDKQLLFSGDNDAFIMFQRAGRSFVALVIRWAMWSATPAGLALPRACATATTPGRCSTKSSNECCRCISISGCR